MTGIAGPRLRQTVFFRSRRDHKKRMPFRFRYFTVRSKIEINKSTSLEQVWTLARLPEALAGIDAELIAQYTANSVELRLFRSGPYGHLLGMRVTTPRTSQPSCARRARPLETIAWEYLLIRTGKYETGRWRDRLVKRATNTKYATDPPPPECGFCSAAERWVFNLRP